MDARTKAATPVEPLGRRMKGEGGGVWGNAVHRSLEPCMARDGSGGDHLRVLPQVANVLSRTRLILKNPHERERLENL